MVKKFLVAAAFVAFGANSFVVIADGVTKDGGAPVDNVATTTTSKLEPIEGTSGGGITSGVGGIALDTGIAVLGATAVGFGVDAATNHSNGSPASGTSTATATAR